MERVSEVKIPSQTVAEINAVNEVIGTKTFKYSNTISGKVCQTPRWKRAATRFPKTE
jgi:hypothetical protein